MGLVEQAVYTSAPSEGSNGYRVVAQSRGVSEEDAAALAQWCPGEDGLAGTGPDQVSINFHPLPSGAYCVSRSVPAGSEYGGHAGMRVYTQCLIASSDVLHRFANNPFFLLRAAMAAGEVRVHSRLPSTLSPIAISSRPRAVDEALLGRLSTSVGGDQMARLVAAAIESDCLAAAGPAPASMLLSGLMSCLPVECRTEFPFSTAQKRCSRRPFRLMGVGGDAAMRAWTANQPNVTFLDLETDNVPDRPIDGWGRWIGRVFATGQFSFLADSLQSRREGLSRDDLPALGLQLIEELDAVELHEAGLSNLVEASVGEMWEAADVPVDAPPRAHAAHNQFAKSLGATAVATVEAPSKRLKTDSRGMLQKLERLDDVVYDAIAGRYGAVEELEVLWPATLAELGGATLHESREQYLRYALQIWDGKTSDAMRNPERAVNAIEVLAILFDDA